MLSSARTAAAASEFVDTPQERLVANHYNRTPARLFVCPGYDDDEAEKESLVGRARRTLGGEVHGAGGLGVLLDAQPLVD